jgi:molecular chaperone GrpE (heat shock protein)
LVLFKEARKDHPELNSWFKKIFPVSAHPHPHVGRASEEQALWQETFRAAAVLAQESQEVLEARRRMLDLLARTYRIQEDLWQSLAGLISGFIQVADYCAGLEHPVEEVQAIQRQLLHTLSQAGLEAWSPEEGQALPEGCEVVELEENPDIPPGTVLKVVTSGYHWKDGRVFRAPRAVVSREGRKESADEQPVHRD